MEAARHLSVVVDSNGEVQQSEETCPHCVGYERELKGKRLQIRKLEKELGRVQGTEPEAKDVRAVLTYWATRMVEQGWWSRRPSYKPGDERWCAVRARLGEGRTVEDCMAAVEGALAQSKERTKRAWMDATSLFRNNKNFEQHFERCQDETLEDVKALRKLPESLRHREDLDYLAEVCTCGHARLDHSKGDPVRDGQQACLVHGCHCEDFDDFDVRVDRWREEHR